MGMRSQKERIRDALELRQPITPLDAMQRFGCHRLAARIKDLRRDGMDIETVYVQKGRARYASYKLR
jgi:hypothetical protein